MQAYMEGKPKELKEKMLINNNKNDKYIVAPFLYDSLM